MAWPLRLVAAMLKITQAVIACFSVLVLGVQADTILRVGINEYANYPDLKHAENDAMEMGTLFESLGHEMIVLTGEDVTTDNLRGALPRSCILQDMAGLGAMMLLDCCYVGRSLKTSGMTKILAAAEYEALESDGHGLFTKYLLNWLKDGNGLAEKALTYYLKANISTETGAWQKPVLVIFNANFEHRSRG